VGNFLNWGCLKRVSLYVAAIRQCKLFSADVYKTAQNILFMLLAVTEINCIKSELFVRILLVKYFVW
jgi:hypothetical protein